MRISIRSISLAALLAVSATGRAGTIADGVSLSVAQPGIEFAGVQSFSLLQHHEAIDFEVDLFSCGFDTYDFHAFSGQNQNALDIEVTGIDAQLRDGSFHVDFSGTIEGTGVDLGASHVFSRFTLLGCNGIAPQCNYAVFGLTAQPVTGSTDFFLSTDTAGNLTLTQGNVQVEVSSFPVDVTGCGAASALFDLARTAVETEIEDSLSTTFEQIVTYQVIPELQQALGALEVDETLVLGDAQIGLQVWPSSVSITSSAGIALAADVTISPLNVAPCASTDIAPTLSAGGASPTGAPPLDTRIAVADDVANELLHAVWRGGALCTTATEIGGLPLSAAPLFAAGLADALRDLGVDEGTPMILEVRPPSPPVFSMAEGTPRITLDGVELRFLVQSHDRVVQVAGLTVDAEIDATLELAGVTSTRLRVAALDVVSLAVAPSYDELVGEEAATAFAGAAGAFLEQSIESMPAVLPAAELGAIGSRLRDLAVGASGDGQFLVLDANLAPTGGGCASAAPGGCGVEGCNVGGAPADGTGSLGVLLLASAWLRRRRAAE